MGNMLRFFNDEIEEGIRFELRRYRSRKKIWQESENELSCDNFICSWSF